VWAVKRFLRNSEGGGTGTVCIASNELKSGVLRCHNRLMQMPWHLSLGGIVAVWFAIPVVGVILAREIKRYAMTLIPALGSET
jgi:hypothetical protein